MKEEYMTSKFATIVILFMLTMLISSGASAEFNRTSDVPAPALAPNGTSFTYQGTIEDLGSPANGSYNLRFSLWDDPTTGSQAGTPQTKSGVNVADGLFSVSLDFGSVFDGTALWLEIEVQGPGDPGFTMLTPRQELTPVPYAINADLLDGQEAGDFADSSHDHFGGAWTGSSSSDGLSVENSGSGHGVYGHTTATSGTNYGV
jgi:hypothetical protein